MSEGIPEKLARGTVRVGIAAAAETGRAVQIGAAGAFTNGNSSLAAATARTRTIFDVLMFLVSASTALAIGFLVGLGIEIIALSDKLSLLSGISIYVITCGALIAPLLALPRSIKHFMTERARSLSIEKRMDELNARKAALLKKGGQEGDGAAQKKKSPVRIWRWLSEGRGKGAKRESREDDAPKSSGNDRQEILEIDNELRVLDVEHQAASPSQSRARKVIVVFYALAALGLLFFTLPPGQFAAFSIALLALFVLFWYVGYSVMALATVFLLLYGAAAGRQVYELPLNTLLKVDVEDRKVRIILATGDGIFVVDQRDGESEKRLSYILKHDIKSISIQRPNDFFGEAWLGKLRELREWMTSSQKQGPR